MALLKPSLPALIAILIAVPFLQPAEAQFTQQGSKLVGTGAVGAAWQGGAVAISADGNTAVVGGRDDSGYTGAAWIYTRASSAPGAPWRQQGSKLVGTGAIWAANQGGAVAISADGNTVIVGGSADSGIGSAWIFTRTNGSWSQQGSKLMPADAVGEPAFGFAVAISGDGNTAIVGGYNDRNGAGAVWIFSRTDGVWSQVGDKLVGTDAVASALEFGLAVAMSTDGTTAAVAGYNFNSGIGAAWIFVRSSAAPGAMWMQQGSKLVGAGAVGSPDFQSVAISADGNTVEVGGPGDSYFAGAAWIFTRSGGVWAQQGAKLVGRGAVGPALQGSGVALSADGNVALVGGVSDDAVEGAFWVFTRSNGVWTQQGGKYVGSGRVGTEIYQGTVAISGDGKIILSGGHGDNASTGAAWIFAAPAPVPASVSPPAGTGTTGTFTFNFSDAGGWQSLSVVDVLIRDVLDGRQACYVAFVPSGANGGAVYLVDDQGDAGGPYSGMLLPAGSSGPVSVTNSQCSITAAGSSVSGSGNMLTLTLAMSFTPGFAGYKVVYLSAREASATSAWQALGTWQVPGSATAGPAVSGISPAHTSGESPIIAFTFTDSQGWQDISVVDVLINTAINGIGACYIAFAPAGANTGTAYLVDDAGDAGGPFAGGTVLPSTSTISNGQCSISGAGSTVAASGNTLTLTLAITFSDSFGGNRVAYLAAISNTQSSGWQASGAVGAQ